MSKLLEMKNITKRFPGVLALDQVHFNLKAGEVHCLLGENGAGKSTLIKILSGAHQADTGKIKIEGQEFEFKSTLEAQKVGVATIYQEFNLFEEMTIEENIFLGREHIKNKLGQVKRQEMVELSKEILSDLGVNLSPKLKIKELSVAEQQMVEIAKALSMEGKIIVMDEPTATLTNQEIDELFRIINKLKKQGIGIIYISHRLEELPIIADRVTVLRDGKYIDTVDEVNEESLDKMIKLMVGEKYSGKSINYNYKKGEEILRVENLTKKGVLENINFSLHKGEILGFAGLVGSGRTELMRCIFGADSFDSGDLYLNGEKVEIANENQAVNKGIAFLTEDRKGQGLILNSSVKKNITLAKLDKIASKFKINSKKETKFVSDLIDDINIKTPSDSQKVKFLSGGNQQKVVLAKWLFTEANLFIFDEPTRGIDVGAKREIYKLINNLVQEDIGIIIVSSEMKEILSVCSRIVVMKEGKISGELNKKEATKEKILELAMK